MERMEYVRRPALAGKNIVRLTNGKIRGSVRRSDPDVNNSAPHFLGATGKTLQLQLNTGAVTVTFTSDEFNQILQDINTAVGANATAFSEDGCIAIRASTAGYAGFVAAVGGTGDALVGFDTLGGVRFIFSRGADIDSAPQGRIDNPDGAVFPDRTENLTRDHFIRTLGKVTANTDVLYSDLIRSVINPQIAESTTLAPDGSYITLNVDDKVFTGNNSMAPVFSNFGAAELAPYFQLIDPSGRPLINKIVAVVRGVPSGEPPYALTSSWSDTTGLSVLGTNLVKTSNTIVSIKEGRFITCSGTSFITAGVRPGDLVRISGATNLTPWSNNGLRWAVSAVLSATVLDVRPLSKRESDLYGTSSSDTQPIVELNDSKSSLESFGSLQIETGSFQNRVTLVVRPPLPSTQAYSVVVPLQASVRGERENGNALGVTAALAPLTTDLDSVENWILSGFEAELDGGGVSVQAGYVRLHGVAYAIPAQTFPNSSFSNGESWLYWSESTGGFSITQDPEDWAKVISGPYINPTDKGHPIAFISKSAGTINSVLPMVRRRAEKAIDLTVGSGGQFQTLASAVKFANTIASENGENVSENGQYPHFTFVIVSFLTESSTDLRLSTLSASIKGATPGMSVNLSAGGIILDGVKNFRIEDLTLSFTDPPQGAVNAVTDVTKIVLQNAHFTGILNHVITTTTCNVENILIDRSSASISSGIVMADGVQSLKIFDSRFGRSGSDTEMVLIRDGEAATWSGFELTIERCRFSGTFRNDNNASLLVNAAGSYSIVRISDVEFEMANHDTEWSSSLMTLSGDSVIERFRITQGYICMAVLGNTNTVVRDSTFLSRAGYSNSVVRARVVERCKITHTDTTGASLSGIGIYAPYDFVVVSDNLIEGPLDTGIRCSGTNSVIERNNINQLFVSNGVPLIGIDVTDGGSPRGRVTNNIISTNYRNDVYTAIFAQAMGLGVISGNEIGLPNPNLANVALTGIDVRLSEYTVVSGNMISASGPRGVAANQSVVGVLADSSQQLVVSNNNINLESTGNASWTGIDIGLTTTASILGNRVSAYGRPYVSSYAYLSHVIDGNTFTSLTGNNVDNKAMKLGGQVSNNLFQVLECIIGCGEYTNNSFDGVTFNFDGDDETGPVILHGNKFNGPVSLVDGGNMGNLLVHDNLWTGAPPSSLTINISGINCTVSDNYVGQVSITADGPVAFTGNTCLGNTMSFTMGGGEFSGNSILAAVSLTFVCNTGGFPTNICNNILSAIVTISGTQQYLSYSNNLSGAVTFTANLTGIRFQISGNRITSQNNAPCLSFPSYTTHANNFFDISNNVLEVGFGGTTAPTTSAILFAGNASHIKCVGNSITLTGNQNPGIGAGTYTVSCLRVVGSGTNRHNVISGNLMSKPGSQLIFGGVTLNYYFWSFGSGLETGGSGNILESGGVVPNTAPGNGGQFFVPSATAINQG